MVRTSRDPEVGGDASLANMKWPELNVIQHRKWKRSHPLCWALLPSLFRAKCQDFLAAVDLPEPIGQRTVATIKRRTFSAAHYQATKLL
jgi:hypothetical protein